MDYLLEFITEIILLIKLLIILNLLIMTILNRDFFLKKEPFLQQIVELKDVDGNPTGNTVIVRQMSAKAREEFEASIMTVKKEKNKVNIEQDLSNYRAKLVVHTVCDENGNLLLKKEDVEFVSVNMTAHTLSQIADAAGKINGLDDSKKSEVEKNLEAAQGGNSTSDFVEN